MPLTLRWIGEDDYDRLAECRMRCYAGAARERDKFLAGIRADPRAQPGDFLLAECDGEAVGTTTGMPLNMWVRGGRVPCQGVAYVGTIRTQRRNGAAGRRGVASELMLETLRHAREREQVVSALMPFRASFYEHFGYGLAEQRVDWTIPLSLMPTGSTEGIRFATDHDRPAIAACRQRLVERGQCDIETSPAGWHVRRQKENDGFQIVDAVDGDVRGWAMLVSETHSGAPLVRLVDPAWDSPGQLSRLLRFLGGQKDQYAAARITLPPGVPVNRLLREVQLPHRPVVQATAAAHPYTRMQVRVLDHVRFLNALTLPARWSGRVVIDVRETEETNTRFELDIDHGRIGAKLSNASADMECTDVVWASIATGDLKATTAAEMGLIKATPAAAAVLDALCDGQNPFCSEYF